MVLRIILILITFQANYYTGQKVFKSKFPTEDFDYRRDTWIRINNGSTDIVVAVENNSTAKVIRHTYIVSGESFTFKSIPIGSYTCKYMWTDKNGKRHYEQDNQSMTFKYDDIGGYEITLVESVEGNLSQSKISENDFFN